MRTRTLTAGLALLLLLSGCVSSGMSYREQTTFTGAALGGVAGAVVTDGSAFGTLGGVAIGGLIGHQVGSSRYDRYDRHYRTPPHSYYRSYSPPPRRVYVHTPYPRPYSRARPHVQRRVDVHHHEQRRVESRRKAVRHEQRREHRREDDRRERWR